ncbi:MULTISPECIES: TetR/AcrR family transcriptional regulator [Rhodococcus]|uniref:TetR/AcrR family transcriptional regulator n=1 Tax=Rhodococcus TaxID=1827 RepID=UPI000815A06D|nr:MULTISPECIES: TetR/AcrR family transcriptional regulator [Rhodococcus]SCC64245.1 transcriptional regulator, TetR family [Rhodococcus qingshengii]
MGRKAAASQPTGQSTPVTPDIIKLEAIRLFSERGYPVIGMRDLSEAVGILPGSLYAHIASKEKLLLDIVASGVRNFTEVIAPIVESDGSADKRLREAIRAHMRVLAVTLDQTRVTFHQWHYLTNENLDQMVAVRRDYEMLFKRLVAEGIEDGTLLGTSRPKVATLSIIGVLGSATEWFSPTGSASADEIGDAIADVLTLGLGTR